MRDYTDDACAFIEAECYDPMTERHPVLQPHQRRVIGEMTRRDADGVFVYDVWLYSAPKKSGKTAVAGWLAEWVAVVEGRAGECLFLANNLEQSSGRAFRACKASIELNPSLGANALATSVVLSATGTELKALPSESASAAGANPSITVWDELWAYVSENSRRLWDELTPVPTRKNSVRLVVTYAGYTGESELLEELYLRGLEGQRLDPELPMYANGGLFLYWDTVGRMPWQTAAYYAKQRASLRPGAYKRLHGNEWVGAEGEAVDIVRWDSCAGVLPALVPDGDKRLVERVACVLGVDAALRRDSFAIVSVSRHPDRHEDAIAVRDSVVWEPTRGETLDFSKPDEWVRQYCRDHYVARVVYDEYQLAQMAQGWRRDAVVDCQPFQQGQPRLIADASLLTLIDEGRVLHDGSHTTLRQHILNAGFKMSIQEDTKGRLVKLSGGRRIDAAVALSMAASECLYLNL